MVPSGCDKGWSDAVGESSADFTVDHESSKKRTFVTDQELGSNDVLFGRGASIINYVGNVRFRELVQTRKFEYNVAICHQIKGEVAKEIFREIVERRNGRFLQRIHSESEASKLGVPKGTDAWKIANDSVTLEKIKQTLRDKTQQKPKLVPAASRLDSSNSSSLGSDSGFPSTSSLQNMALGTSYANEAQQESAGTTALTRLLMQEQERNRQQLLQQLGAQRQQQQLQQQQEEHRFHQQHLALLGLSSLGMSSSSTAGAAAAAANRDLLSQHQRDVSLMAAGLQARRSAALAAASFQASNAAALAVAGSLGLQQQSSSSPTMSASLHQHQQQAAAAATLREQLGMDRQHQQQQQANSNTNSAVNYAYPTPAPSASHEDLSVLLSSLVAGGSTSDQIAQAVAVELKRKASSSSSSSSGCDGADKKPKARKTSKGN